MKSVTLTTYIIGFVLSLSLTLVAYFTIVQHLLPYNEAVAVIVVCALLQCATQLICFLHVGESRERLFALGFAALVVTILVSGSLWIMFTLNGRMTMTPAQMEQYMNDQGGF